MQLPRNHNNDTANDLVSPCILPSSEYRPDGIRLVIVTGQGGWAKLGPIHTSVLTYGNSSNTVQCYFLRLIETFCGVPMALAADWKNHSTEYSRYN